MEGFAAASELTVFYLVYSDYQVFYLLLISQSCLLQLYTSVLQNPIFLDQLLIFTLDLPQFLQTPLILRILKGTPALLGPLVPTPAPLLNTNMPRQPLYQLLRQTQQIRFLYLPRHRHVVAI